MVTSPEHPSILLSEEIWVLVQSLPPLHRTARDELECLQQNPLEKEDKRWEYYVWPCWARPKCLMTAVVSPLPCARRRPCCSTWRSKAVCIRAASWPPCCGPTASLLMRARPCATPFCYCAACWPTPRLLSPAICSLSRICSAFPRRRL